MFANRYFLLLGSAALMLVILFSVGQALARPVAAADIDSATQSYSAWAKAAGVESIDSATRSYRAWALDVEGAAIPVTGNAESPDYYQRHPERSTPAAAAVDMSDYFARHPALRRGLPNSVHTILQKPLIDACFDVSISELAACREAIQ